MIKKLIEETKKLESELNFQRNKQASKNNCHLIFNYHKYDDYFTDYMINMEINHKYDLDQWHNFIVKNIEYIANPAIQIKNYSVVFNFTDKILPKLAF